MKLLYACGDSWTYGDEITDPTGVDDKNYRYYNSWPWMLAENLSIPLCVNDGMGAASNQRTFRRTNDFIFKWLGKGKKPSDLLVVVGWTSTERNEVGIGDIYYPMQAQQALVNRHAPEDPGILNNYHKYFYYAYSDKLGEETQLRYMINLRLLCKGLGIKYYDFIAIGKPSDHWIDMAAAKGITLDNFYKNGSWNSTAHYGNWPRHQYHHPTKENHKMWADLIAKEIVL